MHTTCIKPGAPRGVNTGRVRSLGPTKGTHIDCWPTAKSQFKLRVKSIQTRKHFQCTITEN